MQGSFQVAQATGTGNSTNSAPVRIYTLTKPLTDQAVVINLGYDQKVKVDFSAIAKEKITLVHVGDKLIILFDNQSTITVEPFFDSRADGNVTIEMAPGRDVSVQEFAGLFPIGTDSSVLPAADNGGNSNGNAQASGANFSPFTIDALDPVGTNVLAGPEPLPNFVTPPQTGPFVLQQPAVVAPTIVVNSIASLTLSEANLTAATNGVDGSTHNLALTHVTGNFAVDFADKAGSTGISSVSYALSIPANGTLSGLIDSQSHQNDVLVQVNATTIEGHVGSATGALAFTISVNPATGVVTFTEDRAVDNNAGPVSLAAGTVTLTQTVVDSDGGKASASVDLGPKLSISDDHPTASPDTATAQDGGPAVTVLTGNVASVIGNDLSGADTPINVTAVVATSNGNLAGTVGTALTGEFGKLTLNADGTFSYTANHNVLVGSKDVFTYTVTDDDGTTSSTTLTITIAAGQGPVAGGDSSLSVNESALAPNGSGAHLTPDGATTQVSFTAGADDLHVTLNASALTTLLAGFPNLVWTTAAGGQEIVGTQNGVTVVKFDITAGATIAAGTTGQVTVTETLLAAIQGEGSKSPDLGTLNVVATDTLNGGSVTDHITANVVDDHPTANPDTATAQDGGPAVTVLTGNVASVMANDVSGADTPINVTAVVATSNGNLAGTVGTALTGEFGKLTLNADGTFSYTANHNVLVGSKDVFTYTITDDDGTTSSTTLTITIAAGQGPVAGSDSSLSVNESALAPNGSGVHLTPDVATTQVSFTAGADDLHVTLNASALTTLLAGFPNLVWTTAAGGQEIVGTQNGVTVVKFDITAGATIAAGTSGQVTVTETLLAAIQGEGSKSPDLGTLNVVATDTLNGGSVTDHITANVVDDHPTANPDTATAQDGGPAVTVLTGNVASVMANDVSGADTPINVTAVVATSNGNLAGTVGTALTGEFGKLTLNADGTFSYTANHNVLVGSKDVFTYTITDDDGTTSSTTLTITIAAGQVPVAGSDSSLSVNESALAPNGSGAHLTPDVATTQVSFTAGADDLHVTLNASALTTLLAGFPNLVWTTAAGGQEIVGTQNGVTVVKFDITAGATIAAGTTGQVTVTETLVAAIQGEGSKSPDLGTLNVVATDTLNGGSVTDHITANVVDDKPIWTSADHGVIANVAGISVTGGLQFVTGADGLGLIYFTGVSTDPLHPTATTIQSGGFAVSEYVDANGVLHGVANGAEVFKVVLDPTTSTYTFYLEHALDSYTPLAVNPAKLGGSGPVWYATLADTSGNPVTILTGYHTTPFFDVNSWFNETHDTLNFFQLSQDTVKASSTGEGVHSNVFDAGDFMRFDFGSVGDNSHGDTWIYGTAFGAPAVATGNQISFSVKTLGGGPSIIDYVVHSIDGTVTHGVYNSSTDGAGFTANGHGNIDYVEMYEVCGKSKILLAGITELVNNGQTDVPFTVGVKDGDGDIASGSFDVNVNGGTTLSGTAGNDVIVAGATNETLTGNGGNDKFVLNLAAHFTISDFNSGDLVLLDVSGLSLPAGASNPLTASQFTTSAATGGTENNATAWNESGSANKFFFNNATHELWYSANGTGSDKVDLAHLSTGVPAAANIHIF